MLTEIPRPLATVVGDVVGDHYFHHRTIETICYEAGASGDVPEGNCCSKITTWLVREGKTDPSKALTILGKVLEEFMDGDKHRHSQDHAKDQNRVKTALARYGLAYGSGGRIFGAAVTAPSRDLSQKLREFSIQEIEDEFERAHRFVDGDPPGALTAASAIVEALCKAYIQENVLEMPSKQTIVPLWKVVAKDLNLSPEALEDDDLKRVLSGLSSVVDGIGALRTQAGSAHGQGKRTYKILPRHARLAVHSAHTLTLFVIETWQAKRGQA